MRGTSAVGEVVAVLSMLRAQFYRMAKSRFLIAYAMTFFVIAAATPFALWLYSVWPDFASTGIVQLPAERLSSLQVYGVSFVSGSFIAMGVGVFAAYYVTEDFKSGYMKNLVQTRGGRTSYALAMLVCMLVVSAATTAFGMLVVEGALRLQGYVPATPAASEALQWFVQVTLCSAAYAEMVVLLAVATRSEALAVVGAVFLGGGTFESILRVTLANIPGISVAVRDCLDSYLAVDLNTLAQGALCDSLTYVQVGATILIVGLASVLVMRRLRLA